MPQVLVIFGSQSDKHVFEKLMLDLKECRIEAELKICSAHRNPKELEKIVTETSAKIIVCGAGLSAALPGVVASQTSKPVIGIPVKSNYDGLDSLLSIHQMPSNVPVLGVGVENLAEVSFYLERIFHGLKKIALIKTAKGIDADKRTMQCIEVLEKANVSFEVFENEKTAKNQKKSSLRETIFIQFIDLKKTKTLKPVGLTIFVPLSSNAKAIDSLKLLKLSKKGFWVGLNRGENAAIFALKLLNLG